jgi:tetratricopeptide (TPR) repeat protein
MSLLLDALKKAEKAKEEAQRRAKADETAASPSVNDAPSEPRLSEESPASSSQGVRTRDQLPDISQSLEIATEDLSPASRPREAPRELTLESVEAPAQPATTVRQRPTAARSEAARNQSAGRATAKKVFEAKMREPNPRLPFFISLGVLGVVALGTAIYFWYQLRPPAPLANANPAPTQVEQTVSVITSPNAVAPVAPSSGGRAAGADVPGLPGLPAVPATPEPAQQVAQAPSEPPTRRATTARPERSVSSRTTTPQRPAPQAPVARVEVKKPPSEPLRVARPTPRLDPDVAAGYAAYQAGDLTAARTHYEQALRNDADNRDALLGLAALDMRTQRYDAAASHYRGLLQVNPRDPYALAGLLALRGGQVDPLAAESRVKTLLASDTGTDVLNFTLGNEYARQGRWAEAQQAYFKALAADPSNPDFAYNLAVSLEHIGKPKLALEQYRQALTLAQQRATSFDPAAVRKRVEELSN